jgi:hypothetical protein
MSVSYAPTKIKVPDGFQTLMEDLAKRILAEQPEDVIGFAATYLHGKILHLKGNHIIIDVTTRLGPQRAPLKGSKI